MLSSPFVFGKKRLRFWGKSGLGPRLRRPMCKRVGMNGLMSRHEWSPEGSSRRVKGTGRLGEAYQDV